MQKSAKRFAGHLMTEYVLAPDACAAAGIAGLFGEMDKGSVRLSEESFLQRPDMFVCSTPWRLTVVMPSDPLSLLYLTRSIVRLVVSCKIPPRILILSRAPANWLMLTMTALGCPPGMLTHISVLPSRIECNALAAFLSGITTPTVPAVLLENPLILTPGEYQAVTDWLSGCSAQSCAERTGRSVKTFYLQRHSGLCKLAQIFPVLTPRRNFSVSNGSASSLRAFISHSLQ